MQNYKTKDAKITGIFPQQELGTSYHHLILLNTIPIRVTAEKMMAKLDNIKWKAFQSGKITQMTKRDRIKHDRQYNEYKKILADIKELTKPFLN